MLLQRRGVSNCASWSDLADGQDSPQSGRTARMSGPTLARNQANCGTRPGREPFLREKRWARDFISSSARTLHAEIFAVQKPPQSGRTGQGGEWKTRKMTHLFKTWAKRPYKLIIMLTTLKEFVSRAVANNQNGSL
eukprot:1130289-Amphidinium_carterae.1